MNANGAFAQWEQPSYEELITGWAQRSDANWGAPVGGETRHWTDCPALDTSTMGLVHADGLKYVI